MKDVISQPYIENYFNLNHKQKLITPDSNSVSMVLGGRET